MVKDTGTGILETKLPYIFDRFYQADSSDTRSHEGTGIGLALTKELTELLGGTISVHSIKDKGTAVKIILPIQPAIPMEDNQELQTNNGIAYSNKAIHTGLQSADSDLPLILVVEDSAELRNFICGILGKEYRLLQAANGQEGLLLAIENIPDVVVTDLMMPLMDGYQVCSSLKQNEKTSHIPVIILTAKTDIESRIAGLDTQADAYLDKPFDERELLVTIKNLIAIRRQLQEHYSKANAWLTHTTELPSMEKVFLEKVMSAVELHLDDEQYSVELLAEDIGLSRTQLHRKLKGLIAQSPGDLIRIIRLQRAYELLKSKVGTVAEVSYKVGYGNPKNFSTSFSKHFGFSPSEASNH